MTLGRLGRTRNTLREEEEVLAATGIPDFTAALVGFWPMVGLAAIGGLCAGVGAGWGTLLVRWAATGICHQSK